MKEQNSPYETALPGEKKKKKGIPNLNLFKPL